MKNLIWMLCVLLFTGCATVIPSENISVSTSRPIAGAKALTNIDHIYTGMTRSEVKTIMGEALIIGYEKKDSGEYAPITLPQPHRSENFVKMGDSYVIDFYLTVIKNTDELVSEDELTPVVFKDDKLTGKGWDYYFQLKEKGNEIKN